MVGKISKVTATALICFLLWESPKIGAFPDKIPGSPDMPFLVPDLSGGGDVMPLPGSIIDSELAPNGRFLYLITQGKVSRFVIVDMLGFFVVGSMDLSVTARKIVIRPDMQRAYISTENDIISIDISNPYNTVNMSLSDRADYIPKSLNLHELRPAPTHVTDLVISPSKVGDFFRLYALQTDHKGDEDGYFIVAARDEGIVTTESFPGGVFVPLSSYGLPSDAEVDRVVSYRKTDGTLANCLTLIYTMKENGRLNYYLMSLDMGSNTAGYLTKRREPYLLNTDAEQDFSPEIAAPHVSGNALFVALGKIGERSRLLQIEAESTAFSEKTMLGTGATERLQVGKGVSALGHFEIKRPLTTTAAIQYTSPYLYLLNKADSEASNTIYRYVGGQFSIFATTPVTSPWTPILPGTEGYQEPALTPDVEETRLFGYPDQDGYLYVCLKNQSEIRVITDNPRIYLSDYEAQRFVAAAKIKVNFFVDQDADYECLYFGSDEAEAAGALDLSKGQSVCGSSKTARRGELISVSVPISVLKINEERPDRPYRIYLKAQNSDGAVGRKAVPFIYDDNPKPPRNFKLGFGTRSIYFIFNPTPANDLKQYKVYYQEKPNGFAVDDFEIGINDRSTKVVSIPAIPFHDTVKYRLDGLRDKTKVCARVVAFDLGGNRSEPTATR